MCVDTACSPTPSKPHAVYHFSRDFFAKRQKLEKLKSFRFFELFDFFDFSTFRAAISLNVNFSTFRLFAVETRDFHTVTATRQKSTQGQKRLTQPTRREPNLLRHAKDPNLTYHGSTHEIGNQWGPSHLVRRWTKYSNPFYPVHPPRLQSSVLM